MCHQYYIDKMIEQESVLRLSLILFNQFFNPQNFRIFEFSKVFSGFKNLWLLFFVLSWTKFWKKRAQNYEDQIWINAYFINEANFKLQIDGHTIRKTSELFSAIRHLLDLLVLKIYDIKPSLEALKKTPNIRNIIL